MAVVSGSAEALERGYFIERGNGKSETWERQFLIEPEVSTLPPSSQKLLKELEFQLRDGEITEQGYVKKRNAILEPFMLPVVAAVELVGADDLIEPDISSLPKHVAEELDELKIELENEEITQKGYAKKRSKLLAPYMLKEPAYEQLPSMVRKQYDELTAELKEGDITEKGFRKRKATLLRPHLTRAYTPVGKHGLSEVSACGDEDDATDAAQEGGRVIGLQVIEDGEKVFKCQICGETFKQAQSFSGHCRLHRSNRVKSFKCDQCNLAYSTRSHLRFHMYKHRGGFPYTCQYCNKGFAGRSQHKYHELRHTGQLPFACQLCGGRFWKKESLALHSLKQCRTASKERNANSPSLSSSAHHQASTTSIIYRCDISKAALDGMQTDALTDISLSQGNQPIALSEANVRVSLPALTAPSHVTVGSDLAGLKTDESSDNDGLEVGVIM